MAKKNILVLLTFALVFLLAACSDPSENSGSRTTTTSDSDAGKDIPAKQRPKTKTDTLLLEGMPEELTFTLVDSPELEFSTYITSDMVADSASSSEGDSLFIFSNFAGKLNKDARMYFFARPKGVESSVEEMTELAKETIQVEGFGVRERRPDAKDRYAFSEEEFDIGKQKGDGSNIFGTVSVFTHAKRVYWVIIEYPEEFEEGFVPRAEKALDDIIWYDDKAER